MRKRERERERERKRVTKRGIKGREILGSTNRWRQTGRQTDRQ